MIQAGTLPTATSSETVCKRVYKLASRPGDPDATTFLFGFDTVPIRAEKALYDLAKWVETRPALRPYVLSTPSQALVADLSSDVRSSGFSRSALGTTEVDPTNLPLAGDWTEWRARFLAYLDQFGRMVYEFDFANPTPAEAPEPLLEAVKMYLAGQGVNPHERQQAVIARREQATAQVLSHARWPFKGLMRKSLGWVQRAGPRARTAWPTWAWPIRRSAVCWVNWTDGWSNGRRIARPTTSTGCTNRRSRSCRRARRW